MPDNVVPLTKTTFTTKDFARALLAAWPEATKAAAGVVWAQYALETGRGAACWNNNIGNVKCTPSQAFAGVPYFMLPNTWEIIGGKKITFQPPHAATWFRAFATLAEGMAHHLAFLKNKRYAPAWPAVEAGDPDAFARKLKAQGYYTAPVEQYAAGLRAYHVEWMRSKAWDEAVAASTPTAPPAPVPTEWVEVECDGARWLVAPTYKAPVGIGEAEAIAKANGCELPTEGLVAAIWAAADLKVEPIPMSPNKGDDPAQAAAHRAKVDAAVAGRAFRLLAGTHKDVAVKDGKVGLYGWHRVNGTPIQPFFAGHAPSWKDYSQGLRLVRRVGASTDQSAPSTAPTPDLNTVHGLQARLKALGFDPGPIDGVRGPRTISATKAFQASRGLVADGIVGPKTRGALLP